MHPPRATPPSLDMPGLAVHALWWVWFPAFLASWSALSWAGRLGMLVTGAAVLFWNYAVLHNHMHVPIAKPAVLRWGVSRTLGLACGFPYRGYFVHHFNHHQHHDGPGDWGRRRAGEGAPRYLIRSTLTPWLWPFGMVAQVWRAMKRRSWRWELALDFVVVDGTLLGLVLWEPALGLSYWGMLLVGQCGIYWLNLAAHFETEPAHRDALAVTSTSRLYNRVFFNVGHHQAHHRWPQVPWRQLPEATRALTEGGGIRPTLQTPLAPLNPLWVFRIFRRYSSGPCTRQTESTTTSATPSAVT